MDMLRVFFEISDEDTSRYFVDKAIWKCGAEYRKHQGKYPVIFLTFKDVKYDSWEATFAKIAGLLQADEVELSASLQKLSKILLLNYAFPHPMFYCQFLIARVDCDALFSCIVFHRGE